MNGTNTREKSIAKHVAGSIKVESKHQDCVVSFLSAKQCPLLIDRQYCQNINVRSSMEVADHQSLVGNNLFRLDFGSSKFSLRHAAERHSYMARTRESNEAALFVVSSILTESVQ